MLSHFLFSRALVLLVLFIGNIYSRLFLLCTGVRVATVIESDASFSKRWLSVVSYLTRFMAVA